MVRGRGKRSRMTSGITAGSGVNEDEYGLSREDRGDLSV